MGHPTYKTHFLLATKGSETKAVHRWEHVPTQKEIADVMGREVDNYECFVLTAPVGETHPGKYKESPPSNDYCC